MSQNNYVFRWYEKFGDDTLKRWMAKHDLNENSTLFRFNPSYVMDKIEKEDLFSFGEYVGDFSNSNLISFYTASINKFYSEKNKHELEKDDDDEDDDYNEEIIDLIWENVQDINVSVSKIQSLNEPVEKIYGISKRIQDIIESMQNKKIERNAKYQQVQEIKEILDEMSIMLRKSEKKENNEKRKEWIIRAVISVISFLLGVIIL